MFTASALCASPVYIGPDQSAWSSPENWSSALPSPGIPVTLTFRNDYNNRKPVTSRNDIAGMVVSRLEVLAQSADNVIVGNPFQLTGDIITSTGNWQNIQAPVELAYGPRKFDVRAGRIRLTGPLSGPGTLVKAGGATLTIETPATHSGGTVVELGVLRLETGGETGAVRGELIGKSGAMIQSAARDSLGYRAGRKVDTLRLQNARLIHESSESLTLSSMKLELTGGVITTSGGTLDIFNAKLAGDRDQPTTIQTLPHSEASVISGSVRLRQGDDENIPTVFEVAEGTAPVDLRLEASLSDGEPNGLRSSIQKSGLGLLELAALNTYTGDTHVRLGTLRLGIDHALPDSSRLVLAEGKLAAGRRIDRTGPLLVEAASTLSLEEGGAIAFADSSRQPWVGRVSIEGALRDGASVRFGTDENGLTMEQLARIQINGKPAAIDSLGYLSVLPSLP